MKRGKRPTRAQKILISGVRLLPDNWLVTEETRDMVSIVHKRTRTIKTIKKSVK